MAYGNFGDVFLALDNLGVLDSLLPFLLIFTIIFAILQKTKIIGEGRKSFNFMVALIISLMVVIPHVTGNYPTSPDPVEIINSAIPHVSVVVVAILMLLLLVGVFGKNLNLIGTSLSGIIAIASALIILYVFGTSAGWWEGGWWPGFLQNPDTQALIIIILVFGVVLWFITKDDGSSVNVGGGMGGALKNMLEDVTKK